MQDAIPAAAYLRMSSARQECSITDQRKAVQEYAETKGYRIVAEYVDEGISGWKSDEREAFRRLIEDAQAGKFRAILCWDQDRFSRFPVLEANHYWYLLDKAGAWIDTVAQGRLRFDDLGEWLKASVSQHGKAEYVRDLARNTTRGLRQHKFAGLWVGKAPLGYRINKERRLEPGDPDEIATVQTIFDLRLRGYGVKLIAKQLNECGVRSPRGRSWSGTAVRHVLQRDAYIGRVVIGKHSRAKFYKLTEEVVTLEDQHEPLVDLGTWQTVQAMLADKKQRKPGRRSNAPLAGLVFCGRCGSKMFYHYDTRRDRPHYICGAYHNYGTCGRCKFEAKDLHAAVGQLIRDQVLLGSVEQLEDRIRQRLAEQAPKRSAAGALQRRIDKLSRRISNALERLVDVDASLVPDVQQTLLQLKVERAGLEQQLRVLEQQRPVETDAAEIARRLWDLPSILEGLPAAETQHQLGRIIQRIDLAFTEQPERRKTYRAFACSGITLHLCSAEETQGRPISCSLRP